MATDLKKVLRRGVVSNVPHGVNPKIIVTLYPHGVIGLREYRRRHEYVLGIGALYVQAVHAEAVQYLRERRMKRRKRA